MMHYVIADLIFMAGAITIIALPILAMIALRLWRKCRALTRENERLDNELHSCTRQLCDLQRLRKGVRP